jgi:transposase
MTSTPFWNLTPRTTLGNWFSPFRRRLVPTLRPGDIVIIDNLGNHRGKAIRRAIRAAGAKLFFLPKYSPDLNPIEGWRANERP